MHLPLLGNYFGNLREQEGGKSGPVTGTAGANPPAAQGKEDLCVGAGPSHPQDLDGSGAMKPHPGHAAELELLCGKDATSGATAAGPMSRGIAGEGAGPWRTLIGGLVFTVALRQALAMWNFRVSKS